MPGTLCGAGGRVGGRAIARNDGLIVFSLFLPALKGRWVAIKRGVHLVTTPLATKAHDSKGKTGPPTSSCMEVMSIERNICFLVCPGEKSAQNSTSRGRCGE